MVQIVDPRGRWNVQAARVMRIASVRELLDDPGEAGDLARTATDPLAELGPLPDEGDNTHRVFLLRHGEHEAALTAAGAILIVDVETDHVLPLPREVAGLAPQIAAIIIAQDESLSLLIDPFVPLEPSVPSVRNHA
jgi:hypothetical protein